ncbi:hypothetical protein [Pseudoteredinibacter isoporae]|uniref:Uncharacterized protein n=1 Tax=Pseudoteredinibacter isoporae TaxID=570281 RepID=A0A7X0JWP6_9GAMM|nr:hypothetical protein [Pseudoteredinibacter isoporae]MBB6523618.1 hypothetical protein [Pseudoteredinibacter isoporae]NHO89125.1 hypothetical protein [Pseudoteredinibacter isoporae]NIB22264.1 hypothetical protein [Pseudoteredinibacter isoporae]
MGFIIPKKRSAVIVFCIFFLNACSESWDGKSTAEEMYRIYFEGFPGTVKAYEAHPEEKARLLERSGLAYESGGQGAADSAFLEEFWRFFSTQTRLSILRAPDADVIQYALALANWLDFLADKYGASCHDIALSGSDLLRLGLVLEHSNTQGFISAGDNLMLKAGPSNRTRALARDMKRQFENLKRHLPVAMNRKPYEMKFVLDPFTAETKEEKLQACRSLSASLYYFSAPERNKATSAAFLRSYLQGENNP